MNASALSSYKHKDLAKMAKLRGISGWHAMKKDQLIQALATANDIEPNGLKQLKSPRSAATGTRVAVNSSSMELKAKSIAAASRKSSSRHTRKIQAIHRQRERQHDLSTATLPNVSSRSGEDRIVLMVRDSFWLHAHWQLTDRSVERAQAALAEKWHASRPVLRLVAVPRNSMRTIADEVVREIEIHGAVSNWYIDVHNPPSSFRVDIGYLTSDGQFYTLARSNVVTTPAAGSSEIIDGNWADVARNSDRIFAMSGGFDESSSSGDLQEMFEQRLRRPMGSPLNVRFGHTAAGSAGTKGSVKFQVDAEMIIFGVADPHCQVTMRGEPLKLAADGSFTARVSMPDQRQIIPIVAGGTGGGEEQTIVLAIERNTKVMEPVKREPTF